MKLAKRFWLTSSVILLCAFLINCYGRPKVETNSALVYHAAKLQPGQPAVVTFSALWCHPCREEIDSLNQASQEFAGTVQFRGFLTEGEEKGSLVTPTDIPLFSSFTNEKPLYSVATDVGWALFDSLHTPQGHSLPTLVIFDSGGKVTQVVQQSLDYQTQLRPILVALSQGQTAPPVDTDPTPPPVTKPGAKQLTDSVAVWAARPEVAANPTLMANVRTAFQNGVNDFAETGVVYESGTMIYNWDGANENIPQVASWVADTPLTYCTLKITFNPDGTKKIESGNCRQK